MASTMEEKMLEVARRKSSLSRKDPDDKISSKTHPEEDTTISRKFGSFLGLFRKSRKEEKVANK